MEALAGMSPGDWSAAVLAAVAFCFCATLNFYQALLNRKRFRRASGNKRVGASAYFKIPAAINLRVTAGEHCGDSQPRVETRG